MNHDVIITCAITGAGDTAGKHPALPVTPKQIAESAIAAAKAGAAIVHIHVRDPKTGRGSRDLDLFAEVTDRLRSSDTDVIINLTTGMGGDLVISDADPVIGGPGTDLASAEERVAHIGKLRPEICSLDCGTMNFGDSVFVNTPSHLRKMAQLIRDWGVKPEIEVFDLGHIRLAGQLISDGLIGEPPLFQLCLGIPWGAPASADSMKAMRDMLPTGALWAGFGISRMQMPMVAQAVLLGGNVRVGLEDNLFLERGVFATNAQLVEKAVRLIEQLGARPLPPADARRKLGLPS